jgi:hypothetical protein
MSDQDVSTALPQLYGGTPGKSFGPVEYNFVPLVRDGRVGAEIHSLYSTRETGEDGPAAAIVRYHPSAHAQGELETDDGVYPAGSLLVMPPDSVHTPRSPKGAVGLVVWEQPVRPAD